MFLVIIAASRLVRNEPMSFISAQTLVLNRRANLTKRTMPNDTFFASSHVHFFTTSILSSCCDSDTIKMQLHSVWIFANFFWSSTMAKDGGHLRVRGLQIDSAFSSVDLVLGAFDDVLASKKTGGSKDKGKDDPKSACCAGKPTSLLFFFTGKNCFETLTSGLFEQGDKSSCIPEGPTQPTLLDFPYEIMAESNTGGDAVRIPIDRTKTFQLQFPSNKFESGTILTVYKNGTEFQKVEIHTSCSRTLNLGSEWGAFKLVNYGYVK